MEDRKRPLTADQDDATQPTKRQALSGANRMDPDKEKELELYQKDAILRQMRDYKREKGIFETRVNELTKQAAHHDDHIRLIDAWFIQLLDELRLRVNELQIPSSNANAIEPLNSSLLVQDGSIFEAHLKSRSQKISDAITELFSKTSNPAPEIKELQERLATLLAAEKAHVAELQRITADRDSLVERLENASYRYLVAEKKLDRAKSAVVQRMEQQAIMKSQDDTIKAKDAIKNGENVEAKNAELSSAVNAATESARREAIAISERRKLQIEQLESENQKLTEELTASKLAKSAPSDDEYARTPLFAQLKSQHEDVIKRLNDLEATNIQLREEAQKLHSERTAHRTQLDQESLAAATESESQIARLEADLTRLRNQRDELTADASVKKSSALDAKLSAEASADLLSAKDDRITALEAELERMRVKYSGEIAADDEGTTLDNLSADDLKAKLRNLQKAETMLNQELASMEAAWRKSQTLAAKKVAELMTWEEQVARANAEKAKADQKYFAAMKAKESREGELRMLKAQNAKTSEIVSQLKDSDSSNRALSATLERQLAETKESLNAVSQQSRAWEAKVNNGNALAESLRTEIAELKKLVASKDGVVSSTNAARRTVEIELAETKTRLEDSQKTTEVLRKKSAGKESSDTDDWRRVAICPVCNSNLRNTVLKLCSHVFCDVCVQNLISNRSRKCPSCARAFGANDSMPIILA